MHKHLFVFSQIFMMMAFFVSGGYAADEKLDGDRPVGRAVWQAGAKAMEPQLPVEMKASAVTQKAKQGNVLKVTPADNIGSESCRVLDLSNFKFQPEAQAMVELYLSATPRTVRKGYEGALLGAQHLYAQSNSSQDALGLCMKVYHTFLERGASVEECREAAVATFELAKGKHLAKDPMALRLWNNTTAIFEILIKRQDVPNIKDLRYVARAYCNKAYAMSSQGNAENKMQDQELAAFTTALTHHDLVLERERECSMADYVFAGQMHANVASLHKDGSSEQEEHYREALALYNEAFLEPHKAMGDDTEIARWRQEWFDVGIAAMKYASEQTKAEMLRVAQENTKK